jgi:hypothetical protein
MYDHASMGAGCTKTRRHVPASAAGKAPSRRGPAPRAAASAAATSAGGTALVVAARRSVASAAAGAAAQRACGGVRRAAAGRAPGVARSCGAIAVAHINR